MRLKVLHVITSLGQGGAETVLYRLAAASSSRVEHVVVSLRDLSYYGPRLQQGGITVLALGMPQGPRALFALLRLYRIIADERPDVVQTWMYHADLLGGLIARWAGVKGLVWGIRNSGLDAKKSSFPSRMIVRICALLSGRIPAAIACCSARAARIHKDIGYRADIFTVIPNGYDLARFAPDAEARARVRETWGVGPDETLLGMVGRWHPQKDHANLLHALARLGSSDAHIRCALVGVGMDRSNTELVDLIEGQGLAAVVILAGPHDDIPAVMNALDLHVLSSSYGEAFPNVVAEAMACGTPCVVTDVGDAALIVGDTGWVVPPRDAGALAAGIQRALGALPQKGCEEPDEVCRRRIEDNFSLNTMVNAYLRLWGSIR